MRSTSYEGDNEMSHISLHITDQTRYVFMRDRPTRIVTPTLDTS